jgi:two-component system response regulator PilR (NtrC family)
MATSNLTGNIRILVIDDEPDLRTLYELTLLREGYQVRAAQSVKDAWLALGESQFDLVITDMRLPDGSGTEIIKGIRAQQRTERCVVITAHGSAQNAVECLKEGAFDYLTKPVDLKQFRNVVSAALQDNRVLTGLAAGEPPPTTSKGGSANVATTRAGALSLTRMAGQSLAMQMVRDRVAKVARSMAPVLVSGESGTGKELVANALHANSHRASGPWIAVNCGAIPENLLEAEFFGSKKGSYTGATQDREGFFQAAHGGTLFLDEIGDLPLAMQAKLLRAIQERRVRPIGANQEEPVDVRIVSATHKDLPLEVAQGRFRQDLYYRINVIDICIAPLRERPEDLQALCDTLLARIAHESGSPQRRVSAASIARLASLPLRGNVRELENILHRTVALSDAAEIDIEELGSATARSGDLPEPVAQATTSPGESIVSHADKSQVLPLPPDLQAHLDAQERDILVRALRQTGFNRTVAANMLGLTLRQIRYRIARLRIDAPFALGDERDE